MNILYHGRFQPPHSGHIKLCKFFLELYPKANLIISIDERKENKNNPFSFLARKLKFEFCLSYFENRIYIISHVGFENSWDCMSSIYHSYNEIFPSKKIDLVIAGPDINSTVESYWNNKKIKIIKFPCRIDNISGTKIRAKLNVKNKKLGN